MSLNKRDVHVNLRGGLERKDDEFLVIPTKLTRADDVEFDDANTIITRRAQAQIDLTSVPASVSVAQAARLFVHQNVPYIESRGASIGQLPGGVHRVNPEGGTIAVANPTTVSGHTSPYRFRRAGAQTARIAGIDQKGTAYAAGTPFYDGGFDHATVDGVSYYAMETRDVLGSGRQTIRVVAIDESTGTRLIDTLLIDSTNVLVKPRIVARTGSSTYLYFASFASGGTTYTVKKVTLSSTAVGAVTSVLSLGTGTGGTVEGTANDAALFDVDYSQNGVHIGLVARDTTAAGTSLLYRTLSPSDGSTVTNSGTGTASARVGSLTTITTYDNTNYRVQAFYGIGTNVAKGMAYTVGGAVGAETTIGTGAVGSVVGRLTAYESAPLQIHLAFDAVTLASTVYSSTLRLSRFTHALASLTEVVSSTPWLIAGRIASVQNRLFMPMAFVSGQFQSTVFVVDLSDAFSNLGAAGTTGAPLQTLARFDYGECALTSTRWTRTMRLPTLVVVGDTLSLTYLKTETDLRIAGTTVETPFALARAVIDLESQLGDREANGVSFLAGACPCVFDGSNMVEENFHHGPEIDTAAALTTSLPGYQLPNATAEYDVCFTMAWQDAQGNWVESAPSNTKRYSVTGGSGNYFIPAVGVVTPNTQKPNARVLMYRTKALGTDPSFYLASKQDGTFVTSDTDLDDGEQIYTAGGVLPNTPAPACRHVALFDKRLVLSGCGDGSRIYFSKQYTPGYGVEFSSGDPTHQKTLEAGFGRGVGTAEMDGRLVVFGERGVGVTAGAGPAPTGTQGEYSNIATIAENIGCDWDAPKSILKNTEGVWFQSAVGLRLVSRSGGIAVDSSDGKQMGAAVDSLVTGPCVAVSGDTSQQVRFYQSDGSVHVWDTQWRQWSRFTRMEAIDACYAQGRFYNLANYNTSTPLLRFTGADSEYNDTVIVGGTSITTQAVVCRITTAWFSFAGIQGFQRVYRSSFLGKLVTSDTPAALVNFYLYTYLDFDDVSAGDDSGTMVIQGVNSVLNFEHAFVYQKCKAMKIDLTFQADDAADLVRVRLSDLTLQVGVKSGYFKQPSSKRY